MFLSIALLALTQLANMKKFSLTDYSLTKVINTASLLTSKCPSGDLNLEPSDFERQPSDHWAIETDKS